MKNKLYGYNLSILNSVYKLHCYNLSKSFFCKHRCYLKNRHPCLNGRGKCRKGLPGKSLGSEFFVDPVLVVLVSLRELLGVKELVILKTSSRTDVDRLEKTVHA